jgi:hypothetical protein
MKHALTVACNPGTGGVCDIAEIKGVRSLFTTLTAMRIHFRSFKFAMYFIEESSKKDWREPRASGTVYINAF